jgi:hypothetical protein
MFFFFFISFYTYHLLSLCVCFSPPYLSFSLPPHTLLFFLSLCLPTSLLYLYLSSHSLFIFLYHIFLSFLFFTLIYHFDCFPKQFGIIFGFFYKFNSILACFLIIPFFIAYSFSKHPCFVFSVFILLLFISFLFTFFCFSHSH